MCVPLLRRAGSKQGNLGRPPCVDIGEQRDERLIIEQRCRLNLPRRPSAGAGTVGEALIGCFALLRSRPHIRSVGLPRKLRLLARKEERIGSLTGPCRCNIFCYRHTEAYNKPAPLPTSLHVYKSNTTNPKTHAQETAKRVKTSHDTNPYPPTHPCLGRPPVHLIDRLVRFLDR